MRLPTASLGLLLALPVVACVAEDETVDLGYVADGKTDAPLIQDVAVTVSKLSSSGKPGVRNFTVHASVDFEVTLAYDASNEAKLVITNLDTGEVVESAQGVQPKVTAKGTGSEQTYKIRIENHTKSTLKARLSALGKQKVSAELLAAARANLDRIAKEIDVSHLSNYGLS